jgi:hypothetical protein
MFSIDPKVQIDIAHSVLRGGLNVEDHKPWGDSFDYTRWFWSILRN